MGSIESMELVSEGFQNVVNELYEVCAQWQRMPESFINDIDKMEHDFPFDSCLDEKVYGIALWLSDFKAEIVKWRRKNSPTLTVGELKEAIKDLDDYEQVVIGGNEWYWNINEYHIPDETGEYSAVTFDMGSEVDPRQF